MPRKRSGKRAYPGMTTVTRSGFISGLYRRRNCLEKSRLGHGVEVQRPWHELTSADLIGAL